MSCLALFTSLYLLSIISQVGESAGKLNVLRSSNDRSGRKLFHAGSYGPESHQSQNNALYRSFGTPAWFETARLEGVQNIRTICGDSGEDDSEDMNFDFGTKCKGCIWLHYWDCFSFCPEDDEIIDDATGDDTSDTTSSDIGDDDGTSDDDVDTTGTGDEDDTGDVEGSENDEESGEGEDTTEDDEGGSDDGGEAVDDSSTDEGDSGDSETTPDENGRLKLTKDELLSPRKGRSIYDRSDRRVSSIAYKLETHCRTYQQPVCSVIKKTYCPEVHQDAPKTRSNQDTVPVSHLAFSKIYDQVLSRSSGEYDYKCEVRDEKKCVYVPRVKCDKVRVPLDPVVKRSDNVQSRTLCRRSRQPRQNKCVLRKKLLCIFNFQNICHGLINMFCQEHGIKLKH